MKHVSGLVTAIVLSALVGCASVGVAPVIERGVYNPQGKDNSELSVLRISSTVSVYELNGEKVGWENTTNSGSNIAQQVSIAAGSHVFMVQYRSGSSYTPVPVRLITVLQAGRTYNLTAVVNGSRVVFDIIDQEHGESVVVNMAGLQGGGGSPVSDYIRYVLNPTMDSVGKTVILDNADLTITFRPDMNYHMLDKKTGLTTLGKNGFQTDMRMSEGLVYLLEVDPSSMTREQFLEDSNYAETAQRVWKILAANSNVVRYTVVKPETSQGEVLEFELSVQD